MKKLCSPFLPQSHWDEPAVALCSPGCTSRFTSVQRRVEFGPTRSWSLVKKPHRTFTVLHWRDWSNQVLHVLIPAEAGEIQSTECGDGNAYHAAGLGSQRLARTVCARSCVPVQKSHIMSHTTAGFLSLGPQTLQLDAHISSGKHFQFPRCKIAQMRPACWSRKRSTSLIHILNVKLLKFLNWSKLSYL